jgi:small GTP-binding protein
MSDSNAKELKVVVVGDVNVGKTCLISRLNNGVWNPESEPTATASYFSVTLTSNSGETYILHLWDTAGQEKFNSLTTAYFRFANIALVCYALPVPSSHDLVSTWQERVEAQSPGVQLICVGTKSDIATPTQRADAGPDVVITSALDGTGIDDLKDVLLRSAERSNVVVTEIDPIPADQEKCC